MIEIRVRISGSISDSQITSVFGKISRHYTGGSNVKQQGWWAGQHENGYCMHFISRDIYTGKDREIIKNALMSLDITHVDVKIFACESDSFSITEES